MDWRALLTRHKVPLAVAGVGGAALLGLRAKRASSAAGGTTYIDPSPAWRGAATYDSTSTDLYNSIQPQIENLMRQIDTLKVGSPPAATNPANTPVPNPTVAPSPTPAPGAAPPAPAAPGAGSAKIDLAKGKNEEIYVVRPGDSLSKIARALGLGGWKRLYDVNRKVIGGNPNLIRPGQRLVVPR